MLNNQMVGVHCQSNKEILARTVSTVSDERFKHSRSSMILFPGMNEQNEHVSCAHVTHLFSIGFVQEKNAGPFFLALVGGEGLIRLMPRLVRENITALVIHM